MMATVERDIATGARWSLASKCTRAAALHLDGHIPEPPDEEALDYMERGHIYEDWMADRLEKQFGEKPLREVEVDWPLGTQHVDFLIQSLPLPVEHKSRTTLKAEDSDWLQLAGNCHYGGWSHGLLVITDPRAPRTKQRQYPFELTEWWRSRVIAVTKAIERRRESYPERICKHPSDARGHYCRLALACFNDWIPPDPLTLDPDGERLARELFDLDQRIKQLPASQTKDMVKDRDALRDRLAPRLLNGADYHVRVPGATIRVRRTKSEDSTIYEMDEAFAAGAVTREQLAPFAKTRRGPVYWYVTADGVPETDNGLDF